MGHAGGRPLRRLVLATAAAAAVVVAAVAPARVAGAAPPSFRLADTGVNGSELNVGVAPNGSIFVGGWDHIARSTDDGLSWQPLDPRPVVSVAADRVLIVDHDTGRVLVNDTTLGCTILSWSDDNGASWLTNPAACTGGVTDHQKIAVGKPTVAPTIGYPNAIYVCANGLAAGACGLSVDGGLSFVPTAPHRAGCAFQGVPVADRDGVLYEPSSACGLTVSATPDSGLTWTDHEVGFPSGPDTPDLTVTPDGTLYLFYIDDGWGPALARSGDGGLTWDGPFAVGVPGLTSSVFPSIVAGTNGKVALSFYGATDDDAGWDRNPGNAPDSVRWHGYVAVITDAAGATPTIAPVQVTSDPLQYGCLSKLGGCLNNIADYADIDVGPDGRVYAVFMDGCLPGCSSAAQSTANRGIVAVQTGGDSIGPVD